MAISERLARRERLLDRLLASPLAFPLGVFALTRVFFFSVGAVAADRFTPGDRPFVAGTLVVEQPGALREWAHWDGAWYTGIAAHGYHGFLAPLSTNFFPLYPLLVRAAETVVGSFPLAGVVVSLVAGAVAVCLFHAIADHYFGTRIARASTLALTLFPTAFFLNAAYTESLFLALTTGSLWAALVRRDLVLAGALAGFATATRHVAFFLAVPLAVEALRRRQQIGWRGLAGLALVPGGLLAYMLWLRHSFGDALVFKKAAEQEWARSLANPLDTIHVAWRGADAGAQYLVHPGRLFDGTSQLPAFAFSDAFGLIVLAVVVALLAAGLRVLPFSLWLYAAALSLFPVLYPARYFTDRYALFGYPRYALVAFPLFFVLGALLARSRYVLVAWCAASAVAGGVLTALFTSWRFVA